MDGYGLIRGDRLGRQGEGVTIYEREQWDCMGLCLGKDDAPSLEHG